MHLQNIKTTFGLIITKHSQRVNIGKVFPRKMQIGATYSDDNDYDNAMNDNLYKLYAVGRFVCVTVNRCYMYI